MFVWIVFFLSNLYFVHLLFCKIHNIPLDGREPETRLSCVWAAKAFVLVDRIIFR